MRSIFQWSNPHTHARNIGHVLHGPRERAHETNDESNSRENHSAGTVLGNSVHHDTESQDVTTHNENREEQLAQTEQLATKSTKQDLTGIGQVLNMGVPRAELVNCVTGISRENTQSNNED